MKNTLLIIVLFMGIALTSCNQFKLDNNEAEGLIKKTLELPKSYRYDVGWGNGVSMFGASGPLDALQSAGLITYNIKYHGAFTDPSLYLSTTDLGKPYFLGQNSNVYKFKTNDIDFDKITGISINKESQTAIVRFSLKATNVTLAGYALAREKYIKYSLTGPIMGELVYKKFDSGWQLETEQGKSNSELLNQILESESNTTSNEDYSQQIQILRDEINAKRDALKAKYSSHSDFNKFWADFKKAVNSGDKQAVLEMTNLPFVDKIEDAYNKSTTLTSKNEQTFMSNYDKIFTSDVIKAINKDAFRPYEYDDFIGGDVINEGEFLLKVENDFSVSKRETCDLVFVKVDGVFKLSYVPYYS